MKDLTEPKHPGAEIYRSQESPENRCSAHECLLNYSVDGIHIVDRSGKLVEVSASFCRMLGFSREELLGKHITAWDDIHTEHDVNAVLQPLLAGEESLQFDTRHRRRDGSTFDVAVHCQPMLLEGEKLVFASARDITERKDTERRLKESESRLNSIIRNEPECIKTVAPDGTLLQMNPAGLSLVEASCEAEAVGQCVFDLVDPEYRESFIVMHQRVIQGSSEVLTFRIQGLRGGNRWVETHAVPMHSDGTTYHLAITRDVTQKRLDEQALKLSASVFIHANEGIAIASVDGMIQKANRAFCDLCGQTEEQLQMLRLEDFHAVSENTMTFQRIWDKTLTEGGWSGEVWNRRADGALYPSVLTLTAVAGDSGEIDYCIAFVEDTTVQREQQMRLERLAHFDDLTGLPNRTLFSDRLGQAMTAARRSGRSLALIYLDLDSFKAVNDNYGHDVGDILLEKAAARISGILRKADTMSRFGGDEFVILMPDVEDSAGNVEVFDRILNEANRPFRINDTLVRVSASLGITFFPRGEELDVDQLLRQSDQAMYQAKIQGKNRFHIFDTHLDRSLREQHEILEQVRLGLQRQEFELHYQPKVNMRSGELDGVEALLRWNHPQRQLLYPAAFLPAVEQSELAIDVGLWVMHTALNQVQRWSQQGLDIQVSVNIFSRHIQQHDFITSVQQVLSEHPSVHASQLQFELLESSALDDIDRVVGVMQACNEIGVGFALDDFGTGYSSLSYLKRLPIDLLKVDRAFVRDMFVDADDLSILEGILGLARTFKVPVIAEGVETDAQRDKLLEMGCESGQGFGLGQPMPAEQLLPWLQSRKS